MGLSPIQLLIVVAIILLVFGAKKLPEIGRSLGSGAREFKEGITGESEVSDGESDVSDGESISGSKRREDEKVG